jgi:hypothetical protein
MGKHIFHSSSKFKRKRKATKIISKAIIKSDKFEEIWLEGPAIWKIILAEGSVERLKIDAIGDPSSIDSKSLKKV